MQVIRWVAAYLLILELVLNLVLPDRTFFHQRMDYSTVEKNHAAIDLYLESIKHEIESQNLQNYIILLGDSVGYSGPGPSSQSISANLQRMDALKKGEEPLRVFNLAFPAMQAGDIYTMLLKLDRFGISTNRVIINVLYAGFVAREPGPPAVFWLQQDLQRLDPHAYRQIRDHLQVNGYEGKWSFYRFLHDEVWKRVALLKYKDLLIRELQQKRLETPAEDSIGDARPWYEKPELPDLLGQQQYQRDFNHHPFDMKASNPQILFLDLIIQHQKGKQTMIFLAGTNTELMQARVMHPGYQHNLDQIDRYFAGRTVTYVNLQDQIDPHLYTDHVHLTGEGYREVARLLWKHWSRS